ncbi:efflux transporter outer membrane subunit [Flavobacterium sp. HSC-61S13]|uniref:efflux transporter outer membrane subunit n=1 Tax=Flavobacterium sp. HSC-61S13 TaxID=2910963 RepID=UPI00209D95F0|nr:efflux transporter outer membrane subunit [Flavobacterium sp. HSC-61S13]MCP1994600.1 NodT family efflux transporter outer membrane factor (OMF) lipoprotein [Flavobacterium sp. HSC-61S13]
MKGFIKLNSALLVVVFLQSCQVTKDYVRPELNLPTSFPNTSQNSAIEIIEIPAYNQFFADRALLAILDQVLEHNYDLLIASEHVLAAEEVLKSIKLNYLPEVNMQVNAGIQRLSKNSAMGSTAAKILSEEYTLTPNLSWDIDFWGKLKRQREGALSNYLGQAENRRALRVQLIAQAAQSYYNLLSLDEQLRITQAVEKSMEETLLMLKTQYIVGEVSSLAIKQSEVQLAETRAIIPDIKSSIKIQENTLQLLAGNYPDTVVRAQSLTQAAFSQQLEAGTPISLLANRPDVKQVELHLQEANARLGIAKTEFYPSLKITAQGGLNAIKASQWFSLPASLFGTAATGLTQPLFNKRSIKSAYEQAIHQREAAVHEFRKSVLVAVEEVSTALSTINYIQEQMLIINYRVTTMDKAIVDAQLLYKYGEANYLEVLSIQQSYFQTALAHTIAQQKEINAYIALYKSLGGN